MPLQDLPSAELDVQGTEAQGLPDGSGLVRERALGDAGQLAQLIRSQVRPLGAIEQEVHGADGIDHPASPDTQVASGER